jgi:cytoskeletal protein RodZ
MWVIFYMFAIIVPLIIWGFIAGWREKKTDKENDKTVLAD